MAIRQLNIEGRTYYSYNIILTIYYIGYITKKPQWNVNNANPLYLMINKIKGHFEEVDGDECPIISSKYGDIMQKYQDVFDGIKEIINKINDYSYPIKYDDNYMKIKFNTNENILLNKIIYFPAITIKIRSVTQKDGKYYPQLFLDDCLYEV